MKIYILTGEPFPNGMASTKRIICYAKALLCAGEKVEIIIYRRTENNIITPRNTVGRSQFEGIKYRYIGGTPIRNKKKIYRPFEDLFDKLRTWYFFRRNIGQGDVVIGYLNSKILWSLIFIGIIHRRGGKYISELCEIPFVFYNKHLYHCKKMFCTKVLFKLYDGIIPISHSLEQFATKYVSSSCRILRVPILTDVDKYEASNSVDEKDLYIFHSGTLYENKDGISGILEAMGMAVVQNKVPIRFITTGNIELSPDFEKIKSVIDKYGIQDRIESLGYVEESKLKQYLKSAAIVIVNKLPTIQNTYCFSTKIGEYAASGKAIITTDFGEQAHWFKNGYDSIIVPSGNTEEIAKAIVKLMDYQTRSFVGNNARLSCSKNFDYRRWSYPLKNFVELCTKD